jgi:hypothetical protein
VLGGLGGVRLVSKGSSDSWILLWKDRHWEGASESTTTMRAEEGKSELIDAASAVAVEKAAHDTSPKAARRVAKPRPPTHVPARSPAIVAWPETRADFFSRHSQIWPGPAFDFELQVFTRASADLCM